MPVKVSKLNDQPPVSIQFFYGPEPVKLDYLWAALCMCGAVYFVFRGAHAGG